jgi:hypothetical protein
MASDIRINGSPTPVDNLTVSQVVTLSNFDNTGVTTWLWEILSRPADSTATLSAPTASTTTFTADVDGSWLIRLTTNGTDIDTAVARILTANIGLASPARDEVEEGDASGNEGWALTMRNNLRTIDTEVGTLITDVNTLTTNNSEDVTLAAIGSSPNANAASIVGQVLTLQPASGSFGGVLTAGAQTIGGSKVFAANTQFDAGITGYGGILLLTGTYDAGVGGVSATGAEIKGFTADSGSQVGVQLNSAGNGMGLLTAGSKVVRIINGTQGEVAYFGNTAATAFNLTGTATLSGNLIIPQGQIVWTGGINGGGIYTSGAGTTTIIAGSSGILNVTATSVAPNVGGVSSGLTGSRWSSVNSVAGNFSGQVAVGTAGGLGTSATDSVLRIPTSNGTYSFLIGGGTSASDWEMAMGWYAGALAPVIASRAGPLYVSLASGQGLAPITPDVNPNGDATHRWSNVYSVLGNFSGQVTALSHRGSDTGTGDFLFLSPNGTQRANFYNAGWQLNLGSGYLRGTASTEALLLQSANLTVSNGKTVLSLANSDYDMASLTGALLQLEAPSGGQTKVVFTHGGAAKGGVRSDSAGNFNWHSSGSQGHVFYVTTGIDTARMSVTSSGVSVGHGGAADESLHVLGNAKIYGNVFGGTTGSYSSGTSGARWSNVYSVLGDYSSTLTAARLIMGSSSLFDVQNVSSTARIYINGSGSNHAINAAKSTTGGVLHAQGASGAIITIAQDFVGTTTVLHADGAIVMPTNAIHWFNGGVGAGCYIQSSGTTSIGIGVNNAAHTVFDSNGLNTNAIRTRTATTLGLTSTMVDGASAIAVAIDTSTAWADTAAKLLTISNNGSEVLHVTGAGALQAATLTVRGTNTNLFSVRNSGDVEKLYVTDDAQLVLGDFANLKQAGIFVTSYLQNTNSGYQPGAYSSASDFFTQYDGVGDNDLYLVNVSSSALYDATQDPQNFQHFRAENWDELNAHSMVFNVSGLGLVMGNYVHARGGAEVTQLTAPTNDTFTQGTGTLATDTYYYRVSAFNANGEETLASTATSLAITGPAGVNVKWLKVAGAAGYNIYGRSVMSHLLMATVYGEHVVEWMDDGSVTPSGAVPSDNSTGHFTVEGNISTTNGNITTTNGSVTGNSIRSAQVFDNTNSSATVGVIVNAYTTDTGAETALKIVAQGGGMGLLTAGSKMLSIFNASNERSYWNTYGNLFIKAGNAAADASVGGLLNAQTTTAGNVGAGEDDLQTYTLPANTLAVNNRGIKWKAAGAFANNANSKTLRFKFGSATLLSVTLPTSVDGRWEFEGMILRSGSSTQRAVARCVYFNTGTPGDTKVVFDTSAPTQTDSNTIVIKATGDATSNDDITELLSTVEWV